MSKWLKNSTRVRNKLQITGDWKPWTSRPGVRLKGVPKNERIYDLLDCAYADRLVKLQRSGEPVLDAVASRDLYADFSQGVQCETWGYLQTMCPRTTIYSYENDAVLPKSSFAFAQGWEAEEIKGEPLTALGDGFHCP